MVDSFIQVGMAEGHNGHGIAQTDESVNAMQWNAVEWIMDGRVREA